MIQVPESIKELYHRDTCKKNIRIHFPDGERSDICNDLIVKDTVSFTESLCSQSSLKFGLTESPVFECETVGVGNIKGARIEVFCEIYCDSSITGAEWRVDLEAYVYSIPYGVFIVDSCKRQGDIIHRKIVAYSEIYSFKWGISTFEKAKELTSLPSSTTYTPSLVYFLCANGFPIGDDAFTVTPLPTQVPGTTRFPDSGYYNGKINGESCFIVIKITKTLWGFNNNPNSADYHEINDLLRFSADSQNAKALREIDDWLKNVRILGHENLKNEHLFSVVYFRPSGEIVYQKKTDRYPYYINPQMPSNFYPSGSNSGELSVTCPSAVTYEIYDLNHILVEEKTWDLCSNVTCDKMVFNNSLLKSLKVSFPTIKNAASDFRIQIGEVDVQQLENSFYELMGEFGFVQRNGGVKIVNIKRQFGLLPLQTLYPDDDVYPQGVTGGWLYPEDYQSCWYDDVYSLPFGAIKCTYKDSNEAEWEFWLYLSGFDDNSLPDTYQVYDLSENYVIQQNVWTQNQIQSLCENIANNINGVSYMPVDFVGRGLPYVEAGDTFEILTKSNESITTIVLNRTITGEQTLTDSYKSVGE